VSQASNSTGHERWEGDAAAYALGALEQPELAPFEQHLATCTQCQRDLVVMRGVVDALPTASPHLTPEAELKQRVMSGVREGTGRQPASADAPALPKGPKRGPSVLWGRWPAPVPAAAAAIAVALAVVIVVLSLAGGNPTRTYGGTVTAPGATASVRVTGGHARLVFARLPKLPPQLIYEMWLKRGPVTPVPAGALFATSSGAVGVPGGVHGVQAVLVTAEPRPSGTRKPTRAPIIVVRLT
jgi:anti-sigma factor RsiW